jgi:hypothetical protein
VGIGNNNNVDSVFCNGGEGMKKIVAICFLVTFLFVSISLADTIQIPLQCYPKNIQQKFAKVNKKLDLSANDREKDSWAFIRSNGTNYDICTYAPVTMQELELIQKVVLSEE